VLVIKWEMALAPIVLFVYNRPWHTQQTLDALSKNELASKSKLYIYSDGPQENAAEEQFQKIKEVRSLIRKRKWCGEVEVIEHEKNLGLAGSIISGVTEVVNESGQIIVLEDDIISSSYFLNYMNDALALYDGCEQVACISAYIYPVRKELPETFFMRGADCWGWATWQRAWNTFEEDGAKLLQTIRENGFQSAFDFGDAYPFTQMLEDLTEAKNDSWAIRWYASSFLKEMYCLYPGRSLVQNIGIDGSGIHSHVSDKLDTKMSSSGITVNKFTVRENTVAKKLVSEYFLSMKGNKPKFLKSMIENVRSFILNRR